MKGEHAEIEAFLRNPAPHIRLALFHGNDEGLVRERADRLAATVVPDAADPFRVARLGVAELADDPARLADEAAAIAMGGGRRVVRIAPAGDRLAKIVAGFLAAPMGDALVVIEAEQLAASSSLRKAVEAADNAMAIACYHDEAAGLARVIAQTLAQAKIAVTDEARTYLLDRLGGDRMLTRRELEKLVLYAGPPDARRDRPITLEECRASVGDVASLTYDDLCSAVAAGDRALADRCLARLEAEGESAVAVLRIVGRHFRQLHEYHAATKSRQPMTPLLRAWRMFGPREDAFRAAAGDWPAAKAVEAMRRISDAEARCKSTGYPDWTITARTLTAIAGMAAPRRERP